MISAVKKCLVFHYPHFYWCHFFVQFALIIYILLWLIFTPVILSLSLQHNRGISLRDVFLLLTIICSFSQSFIYSTNKVFAMVRITQ